MARRRKDDERRLIAALQCGFSLDDTSLRIGLARAQYLARKFRREGLLDESCRLTPRGRRINPGADAIGFVRDECDTKETEEDDGEIQGRDGPGLDGPTGRADDLGGEAEL